MLGDDTPTWRARLGGVRNEDHRAMPVALQHAFWAFEPLASPEGEAELRALAAERGRAVPFAPGRAADVAAWAFLDERTLFRDARARVCTPAAADGAPLERASRSLTPVGTTAPRQDRADDDESRGEVLRRR